MKKLLIFLALITVVEAESLFNRVELTRIAQESAEKVNRIQKIGNVIKDNTRKYSIGYSINTTHIKNFDENGHDYKYYEDNKVLTLETEKNKELIGLVAFKNSFGNDTIGVYGGKKIDKNNKSWYGVYRLGILNGYNYTDSLRSLTDETVVYNYRNHTVFYRDYSLLAEVGLGYQVNKSLALETNLIANAVVTSVKYTF